MKGAAPASESAGDKTAAWGGEPPSPPVPLHGLLAWAPGLRLGLCVLGMFTADLSLTTSLILS